MVRFFFKMIVLNKNIDSTVILTLTENQTHENSDWLIKITNDLSGKETLITLTDLSQSKERYNKFIINLNEETGFSSYVVYEMPVASPKSTDISLAYGIVEIGKVFIDEPKVVNVFSVSENKNNAVFE